MKKKINFKELREKNETKEDLKKNPNIQNILKEHVMLREGLSDNALVSLIVYFNGHDLNEEYKNELELFKYVTEYGSITETAKEFIEEKDTIKRLKDMVG